MKQGKVGCSKYNQDEGIDYDEAFILFKDLKLFDYSLSFLILKSSLAIKWM